jgi:hypothetical protein
MNDTKSKELRRYILDVKLTPEQQKLYADGEFIWVENMKKTDGTFFSAFAYEDEMKGLSFSSTNLKELAKELNGKTELKTIAYGGVAFTPEQIIKFNSGKTIYLEGAVKEGETIPKNIFITKTGNKERDIDVVVKKSMQNTPSLAQIKQISIVAYLAECGFEPVKIKGDELWYSSPVRDEGDPSFKVNRSLNTFKDFGGDGKGGSIIDLVMVMYGISFADAVKNLSERSDLSMVAHIERKNPVDYEKKITVSQVKPLEDRGLFAYLYERGIDPEIAKKHCKQVHYKIDGIDKEYYAVGFQNDKGDWELRNKYFKGCTGKNITRKISPFGENCSIFEGFMDFLSYETLHKQNPSNYQNRSHLILNGITNIEKNSIDIIDFANRHMSAHCFMDNDTSGAGKIAFEKLNKLLYCTTLSVSDCSQIYAPLKDLNALLVEKKKEKQLTSISRSVKKNVGVKF